MPERNNILHLILTFYGSISDIQQCINFICTTQGFDICMRCEMITTVSLVITIQSQNIIIGCIPYAAHYFQMTGLFRTGSFYFYFLITFIHFATFHFPSLLAGNLQFSVSMSPGFVLIFVCFFFIPRVSEIMHYLFLSV